jgi:hypothetical protein
MAETPAAVRPLRKLRRGLFYSRRVIFLTLTADTRIRVAVGRNVIHTLCLSEQQTIERRKEISMAKKAKKADKKATKKAK